ncbi:hypothetical protein HY948_03900 [Candidatus Gottesmanbacteria bacterium]|nr:hypothetical protein [Candidatus Gottesmanbacteria bacterium]
MNIFVRISQRLLLRIGQNAPRILVMSLLFSVLTFASIAVPYINIFLSPKIILAVVFVCWYMLFCPPARLLENLSIGVVLCAMTVTVFRFWEIAEWFGEFLFMLLFLIALRYLGMFISRLRYSHEA